VLATAASAGLDVALIALGVLAFWELRRYSAVPRLSGGSLGIDPVLSVAPVLALAGAALLPLRLLPAAARLLDRASARGRRLATALASWQVSRRPVREGGPVLLVVLAVATGTLVLAQHQSWRQSQLDQAAFATGADVRVGLATPLPLGRGASLAQARGVLAATPVAAFNTGFSVYALGAATAAGTVLLRPDLSPLPKAVLWHRIAPAATGAGLLLPGRPARLDVTAMLSPPRGVSPAPALCSPRPRAASFPPPRSAPAPALRPPPRCAHPRSVHLGAMSVSLSVQDGSGIVYAVPAGNLPADGHGHHLTASLSTGQARYPLRLLGVPRVPAAWVPPSPQPARSAGGGPQRPPRPWPTPRPPGSGRPSPRGACPGVPPR
jgi:hypothetical protein